jgi:DNA polymerase III subunit delta
MKIAAARGDAFARKPDPNVKAVLLFGPDSGLARERASALVATVVPDRSDPFRIVELDASTILADPARLFDEADAMTLLGGRRAVCIRNAEDTICDPVAHWLVEGKGEALLIIESGALTPRSKLRALFEAAANAAAIGCYADDARSLPRLIADELAAHELEADEDAIEYLAERLGADRMQSRSELAKLALFKGGPGRVSLADASACVGDAAAIEAFNLAHAIAGRETAAVDRAVGRLLQAGESPVGLLRVVMRHFERLQFAAARIEAGRSSDEALASLRPPARYPESDRLKRQLGLWRRAELTAAIGTLLRTEIGCKTTGWPAGAIMHRAFLELSAGARRFTAS